MQRKKEKVLAIQRDEGLELKDKIDKLVDSAEYWPSCITGKVQMMSMELKV